MMASSKKSVSAATLAHHHQQQDAIDTMEETRNVEEVPQQQVAIGDGVQKPRPKLDEALKCPRCESNNTKFCYYNNYNMSQPRYFCKACHRYWTQGGTLRNIPVGGGHRKNKRSSSSLSASTSSSNTITRAINNNLPTLSALTSFPNVLPTFVPTDFEFSLTLAPPLSLSSSLAPAPALAPGSSMTTTPTFLDILRGGFLQHQSSDTLYEATPSGSNEPPLFGFSVMQHGIVGDHHGGAPIGGGNATATTQLRGYHQWAGKQHGHNNDDGSTLASDGLQQVGAYQQREGVLMNRGDKNGSFNIRDSTLEE